LAGGRGTRAAAKAAAVALCLALAATACGGGPPKADPTTRSRPPTSSPTPDPAVQRCLDEGSTLLSLIEDFKGVVATLDASGRDLADLQAAMGQAQTILDGIRAQVVHAPYVDDRTGLVGALTDVINGIHGEISAQDKAQQNQARASIERGASQAEEATASIHVQRGTCVLGTPGS
jgi:hypothetical protein